MAHGPGMILYRTLDYQVDLYLPLMENFQKRIDEIEKACFEATTSATCARRWSACAVSRGTSARRSCGSAGASSP